MNDEDLADMDEYFQYLEDLKESGETNMYGAAPHLRREFGLNRKESHDILEEWMGSYKDK
mgnify:CR=1 FL=1